MFNLDAIRVRLDGHGWHSPPAAGGCRAVLWADPDGRATLLRRDGLTLTWPDPLSALDWLDAARADGHWFGYLSYDLGRWFESLPARPPDDVPLFVFTTHDDGPAPPLAPEPARPTTALPHVTRVQYEAAVQRCIEYIRAGDIFQVNISQRFTVACPDTPQNVYARLPPTAYAACLDYGPFAVVSHSPELFLHVDGDRVVTRPIKGTRPNRPGMAEQLLASEKDEAELHMIVDLERNDLGRVCRPGTVRVTQPRTVEAHPTVVHGVATVAGHLRPGVSLVDLLRATFPGGSITGAPKVRAMQIIDEMEPHRRGVYCGAVGHLWPGGAEFNVAIRTMTVQGGTAAVCVGGGIVADSVPADEYDETLVKATALLAALGATL